MTLEVVAPARAHASATPPPHDGQEIVLSDGLIYVVPPLSLGQVKRNRSMLTALGNVNVLNDEDGADKVLNIAFESLKRNYPDITIEKIEDIVTLGNMQSMIAAVLGVNGYRELPKPVAAKTP